MRPGQNKRMRGRNNNNGSNRKGPNPLTRSFESNGPDVKIRGTAHHVAEKYLQLARDAQSSGDPVAAENYLQHAEHYFRLIASAQLAQSGYARPGDDIDLDEDDSNTLPDRFASPSERVIAPPFAQPQPPAYAPQSYQAPQPYGERPGYNGERPSFNNDRQPPQDRQERYERNGNGYERPPRPERNDRASMGRGQRPYRDAAEGRGPDNRVQDNRVQDNRLQDNRLQDNRVQDSRVQDGRGQDSRVQDGRGQEGRDPRDLPRENFARTDVLRDQVQVEPRYPEPARVAEPEPVRAVEMAREEAPSLPAFITAPVRLAPVTSESPTPVAAPAAPPVAAPLVSAVAAASPAPAPRTSARAKAAAAPVPAPTTPDSFSLDPAEEAARFPPRRRRRTRTVAAEAGAEAQTKLPVSGD